MPGNDLHIGNLVGSRKQVILPAKARGRHTYISGGTGVGKSKFLEDCIQQDILNWRDSRCGLLLLDPHGLVYKNTMNWLASSGLKRPVVPIDLHRDDWIISYNLLRKRKGADEAVVVADFVKALAYVWGEGGTDGTPLFARWATVILLTLYMSGNTISDFPHLMARDDVRQAMIARLGDQNARNAWEFAKRNRKEFDTQMTSTLNRFNRMSGPRIMNATFGQPDASFDLLTAIEEGQIVLVNLSRKGGTIAQEDADTYATILLADLWAAAASRDKQEEERVKPFYVYVDECQRFITPTIADNLDEARGYGLHLTLANQYPSRFLHAGPHGQAMYDSIWANAHNKICFKQSHPADAKSLGEWLFMNTFDTDEVKHEIWSTKVVGTREVVRESTTEGTSHTKATSTSTGGGSFHGQSLGEGIGGTESFHPDDLDEPAALAAAWNSSIADSSGESENWSSSESEAIGTNSSKTKSTADVSIFQKELSSRQYRSVEEQVFRAMQKVFDQEDRHYAIRFHGGPKAPLFVKTPTVDSGAPNPKRVQKYREKLLRRLPFAKPMTEAMKQIEGREQKLLTELVQIAEVTEPVTAGRRVK